MKYRILSLLLLSAMLSANPVHLVHFERTSEISWGILQNNTIKKIREAPWLSIIETGEIYNLSSVTLLPPVSPSKVLAVGLNYKSHSGNAGAAKPELFAKFPSSLQGEGDILIPSDATNIHYEGELVIVMGKRLKNADEREASEAIFGVTIGNDISERNWQASDLQWFRAKASDGFAPVGPVLIQGLDWSDLLITTSVNGEIRQNESTAKLIHSPEKIVSWISQYVTLEPGDIIFTGTPGRTQAVKNGDTVEVTIQGIGTLKNRFVWKKKQLY